MTEEKTHYRKVFKSDHLGIADLEDFLEEKKRLVFTIKEVKQHFIQSGDKNSGIIVAGKRISANIAYFNEDIKPLVLNATNSKLVKKFNNNSPFVEDWKNVLVELYIDPAVKFKGETTGGVRIKPTQPSIEKPELTTNSDKWNDAVEYMKKEGSVITNVTKYWKLSKANEQLLIDAAI
jgi:hypothetical protein